MGLNFSYLDEPITDKESFDDTNEKLVCGASSMQGWRPSQEDAHNCILNFDKNASFFAVYDGHGGSEVSMYCAKSLPEFIKNTTEYKEGKIEEALIEGFLRFDATITTPEVIGILQEMKKKAKEEEKRKRKLRGSSSDDSDYEEEENMDKLYEEASMPIEQVIRKYDVTLKTLAKEEKDTKDSDATVGTSASCSSSFSSSSAIPDKCGDGVSSSSEADSSDKKTAEDKAPANVSESVPEEKPSTLDSSDSKNEIGSTSSLQKSDEAPVQNGEVSTPDSEAQPKSDVTSSSLPVENGTPSKKGKGKAIIRPEIVKAALNMRPKRNAQKLYEEWLKNNDEEEDDSEESDDEDQTFEGPNEESSEDDAEGVNVAIETSEDESSEVEGGEDGKEGEEEDDDEEERDNEDDEGENLKFSGINEVPGSDSGCTAVVALLKDNELYVANAGDSRCIVCRNGKAVEMSFDHKPRNKQEYNRITKAGGYICCDDRVNGGLNLSRAIGDHTYKQNKELSEREQMIIALPDIKKLTINPHEDEFMVLACDGIWDSLSNQAVVDFVRPRILEGREKISTICEEMFDHCLSGSTLRCKSCDNMTAIIVKFKSGCNKRAISPSSTEESNLKRAKSEENEKVDTPV